MGGGRARSAVSDACRRRGARRPPARGHRRRVVGGRARRADGRRHGRRLGTPRRAAEEYATSWHAAPPGSWGRPDRDAPLPADGGDAAGARADAEADARRGCARRVRPDRRLLRRARAARPRARRRGGADSRTGSRRTASTRLGRARARRARARAGRRLRGRSPRGAGVVRGARRLPRGRRRGRHGARAGCARAGARRSRSSRCGPASCQGTDPEGVCPPWRFHQANASRGSDPEASDPYGFSPSRRPALARAPSPPGSRSGTRRARRRTRARGSRRSSSRPAR